MKARGGPPPRSRDLPTGLTLLLLLVMYAFGFVVYGSSAVERDEEAREAAASAECAEKAGGDVHLAPGHDRNTQQKARVMPGRSG